jgi:hypothetical protein
MPTIKFIVPKLKFGILRHHFGRNTDSKNGKIFLWTRRRYAVLAIVGNAQSAYLCGCLGGAIGAGGKNELWRRIVSNRGHWCSCNNNICDF